MSKELELWDDLLDALKAWNECPMPSSVPTQAQIDMWLEYKGLKGGVQPELKLAQGDAE